MAIQKISGVTIDLIDQAAGDVAYYDSEVNSWVRLAKGVAGEVLTMNESETAPQWGAAPPTWSPLGTLRGYSSGGNTGLHSATSRYDRIDNYSFTSDGNATDWGDLVRDSYMSGGTASATHGYVMGGEYWNGSVAVYVDTIQKFSMAANADATDVGDASISRAFGQGSGHSDGTYGYSCYCEGPGLPSQPLTANIVDRFPFATDTNATDVGNMNVNQTPYGGISSTTHGYYTADMGAPNASISAEGNINQFAFASPATATDVGDILFTMQHPGGSMSETHGYISGGHITSNVPGMNTIQKFSFATLGNSTDVGDLQQNKGHTPACSSSTTHNYNAGGWMGEQNPSNVIDKWSTSTDGNSTDVGDLWAVNYGCVGAQV